MLFLVWFKERFNNISNTRLKGQGFYVNIQKEEEDQENAFS